MTISIAPARNEYTANAGQTIFNYTFKIFEGTDLNVYITKSGQDANDLSDLTTAYTVNGLGNEDGGTITLITGTNANDLVTIVSDIPSSRIIDYQNNGDFRPETVNADFDRVVSIAKKIEDTANRTVLLQQSKQNPKPLSLPEPEALQALRWNVSETGLDNYDPSELVPDQSIKIIEREITLVDGQLTVIINDLDLTNASISVYDDDIDSTEIYKGNGYELDSSSQITLDQSYPAGTKLIARSNERKLIGSAVDDVTFFVSSSGSDTNKGTTPDSPFKTIQKAIDRMYEIGDIYPGLYNVRLAAGTYSKSRFRDDGAPTRGFVTIEGPDVNGHPNIPIAFISEGVGTTGFGILASQGTKLMVRDVKFIGWNGSTASTGVRGNGGCWVYTDNCHFELCQDGVGGYENSVIDVKGGIFDGCVNPVIGLFNTKFQVGLQNAGTLNFGPIIRNSSSACRLQEGGTGHFDYVTVEDCVGGVRLLVNSRLNLGGTSLKRIDNSAIYSTQGCYADTLGTIFGTGADANGANYSVGHSSSLSSSGIQGVNTANSSAEYTFSTSYPETVISNTANEVIESQVINENALNDTQFTGIAANRIGVRVTGELSGINDFKRLNLRVGSSQQTISFASASPGVSFTADLSVDFIGPNRQYMRAFGSSDQDADTSSLFITENTSADLNLQLEAVVGNAADSITINSVEWYQRGF